jgi:perosamine synthetase
MSGTPCNATREPYMPELALKNLYMIAVSQLLNNTDPITERAQPVSAEARRPASPEMPQTACYFDFYMGRVALYALLMALEVGAGDEVVIPAYTCLSVIEPIVMLGATPVYCDIETESYGLDPRRLEQTLTGNTRAVIVQHTFGIPARLAELLAVPGACDVAILEDCCHVAASKYCGRELGRFGDAAFFSHASGKQIPLHTGGVAVVNSAQLRDAMVAKYYLFSESTLLDEIRANVQWKMEFVKRFMITRFPMRFLALLNSARTYWSSAQSQYSLSNQSPGWRYRKRMPRTCRDRLDEICAKFGDFASARRHAIGRYESGFRDIGLECFTPPENSDVLLWRYPLAALDKAKLLKEAEKQNIKLYDWGNLPLELLRSGASDHQHLVDRFPVASRLSDTLVTLAINASQPERDIDRTLEFLRAVKNRGWL